MCEEGAESTNNLLQNLWRGLCNFKGNCNFQISIIHDAKIIGGHLFDMHEINDIKKKNEFKKLIKKTIALLNKKKINQNIKHFVNFLMKYKKNDDIPNIYLNSNAMHYNYGFFFCFFFGFCFFFCFW